MITLFTSSEFDIVESADRAGELVLLRHGHDICSISGQCAEKMRWLFEQLRAPAFAGKFLEHTNCHGLAEYVQGRSLKWRDTPKALGVECIRPNAVLPRELPLTYQFMNGSGKAVHSGVVLGRRGQEGPVYILDKLHSCPMRIEPYVHSVRDWVRMICPLSMVRLRRPSIEVVQSVRKAA